MIRSNITIHQIPLGVRWLSPKIFRLIGIFEDCLYKGLCRSIAFLMATIFLMTTTGCIRRAPVPDPFVSDSVTAVGFSIQAGAFSVMDNAIRLTDTLRARGVEAVYFVDTDKLYKVRFGDFIDWESADRYARDAREKAVVTDYFIVSPQSYPVQVPVKDRSSVRNKLAADAYSFLGCPYRWGGTVSSGFDCSGLAMTVYRLSGIVIPRTSAEQFDAGKKIARRKLRAGDLVFFRSDGGRRITHVGIYVGNDEFIHAPGRGKNVRKGALSAKFYKDTFAGARTFLR